MDKNLVAERARGHWAHVLQSLCRLDVGVFDGRNQPCPKCGGTDRFRVYSDFAETGGFYCNQCKQKEGGDGFAFLQWFHGWTFSEAVNQVGRLLAVAELPPVEVTKKTEDMPLAEKWRRWGVDEEQRRALVAAWCAHRAPSDPEAALQSGAMVGNWPAKAQDQGVVAFAGSLDGGATTAALLLYRQDGSVFPALGKLQERKTHLVGGSRQSWVAIGGWDRVRSARVIVRVEGIPDGLALLPLLPADWAIVTATCGAAWNRTPAKQLPLDLFDGRAVVVVGDADSPGQDGAAAMATSVLYRGKCAGVLMARLPYAVQETKGADLRDWLQSPRTFSQFKDLLFDWRKSRDNVAAVFGGGDAAALDVIFRNWTHGEKKQVARPLPELVRECQQVMRGWPRRVNDQLFVDDGEIRYLQTCPKLFAALGYSAQVEWSQADGMVAKREFFEALAQRVKSYRAIEHAPHHPRIPEHYYACGEVESGDGRCLAWLMRRLFPATPEDRYLIVLMLATVFWGGPAGQRPAFVVTADGRGAGKTTLAAVAGELSQGVIDVGAREDVAKIKERLLTPEARDKRIVQIDNIKAHKFSSAEVEALITAPVISGRELYHGESQRPNTVLWVMTMNGVSLSKDVAQRSIIIRLRKPVYSESWHEETFSFIREHRREIVADLLAFLRAPGVKMDGFSRWGVWERAVMARDMPAEWDLETAAVVFGAELDDVRRLVQERQESCDVDTEEASMFEEYVAEQLRELGYDPLNERVWVSSSLMAVWYGELNGAGQRNTVRASRAIIQQIEEGALTRLARHKMARGQGFTWTGADAAVDAELQTDAAVRMDERKRHRWQSSGAYGIGGSE